MLTENFNDRFRQVFLFSIIITIAVLLITQLSVFIPGLLGGLTLYILSRSFYFKLIADNKCRKGLAACIIISIYLIIIAIPVYISIALISPKINQLAAQQDKILHGIEVVADKIKNSTGISILTADNAKEISAKISVFIPMILNSTAVILTNILMMFFLFYYLLMNGQETEKYLRKIIPLKPNNIHLLASETKMLVKANALGIPLICIIQGIFAAAGYWFFGVKDWALWGFFTGVFAFFPLVGTMIIWVPLVLFLFATGVVWPAIWLTLYSFFITGNVDYLARMTLMKKLGNVHPLITVLGVIVGLNLFGFMGLIFGPLLVSYFIVLIKIYLNEFAVNK